MKAVVKTGGKQYVVAVGDEICVEKIDIEAGNKVELNEVLLVTDGTKPVIGAPRVKSAKVECTVVEHVRAPKAIIYKFFRRSRYRRYRGHRQPQTILKIEKITA